MGYNTHYTLEVKSRDNGPVYAPTGESIISRLRSTVEEAEWALTDDGKSEEAAKWYDHETDMRAFSEFNPHFLFILRGEGEESGDVWIKYFLAGKCQVCKATLQFPPYNPALLK